MIQIPKNTYKMALSALMMSAIASTPLLAQEVAVVTQPVVITANRLDTPVNRTGGSSVSVISSEAIETSQQTQVTEILKGIPGLTVHSNGGPGTLTSVTIRGAASKNTLILIDGIPFNDPATANRSGNLGAVTLDNVERIEVVRGAQSVLYGSNATAGVINIITKKGKGTPEFTLKGMLGSFHTKQLQASVTGKTGVVSYSLAGSQTESEGFSIANDRNSEIPHAGNTDELDAYSSGVLSANLTVDLNSQLQLEYVGRRIVSRTDLDDLGFGSTGDRFDYDPVTYASIPAPHGKKEQHSDSIQSLHGLKLHFNTSDHFFESSVGYSLARHDSKNFDADGLTNFDALGFNTLATYQGTLNWDLMSVTLGVDSAKESYKDGDEDVVDATLDSVWINDQIRLLEDDLILVLGARKDEHETFGSATTYRMAPSYHLGKFTLKGSYGTGFRAPSLYELYSVYGNETLDPEKSVTWDAGFEHQFHRQWSYGVTWFDFWVEDEIEWVANYDRLFGGQYQQSEGRNHSNGTESFIAYQSSKKLNLRLDHTYTFTEDPTGKRLSLRPQHQLALKSIYNATENTDVNTSIQWVGERDATSYDFKKDGSPVKTLDAYNVIDIAVSHRFMAYLEGFVRLDNVTDEVYETSWSYAQSGRAGYAGLKASF